MTMSLTLVNTSNWDNEDYEIEYVDQFGNKGKGTIRPGEMVTICPSEKAPTVKAVPRHNQEVPFYMNGRQMFPRVDVSFSEKGENKNFLDQSK